MAWPLLQVTLPQPAQRLQQEGRPLELVAELGDNYGTYHAALAAALAEHPVPNLDDFDDGDAFVGAVAQRQNIIGAEAVLRACRQLRAGDGIEGFTTASDTPLVDGEGRLVAVA